MMERPMYRLLDSETSGLLADVCERSSRDCEQCDTSVCAGNGPMLCW